LQRNLFVLRAYWTQVTRQHVALACHCQYCQSIQSKVATKKFDIKHHTYSGSPIPSTFPLSVRMRRASQLSCHCKSQLSLSGTALDLEKYFNAKYSRPSSLLINYGQSRRTRGVHFPWQASQVTALESHLISWQHLILCGTISRHTIVFNTALYLSFPAFNRTYATHAHRIPRPQ
jgi:hypothetical protein